jgi:hypothetical protein
MNAAGSSCCAERVADKAASLQRAIANKVAIVFTSIPSAAAPPSSEEPQQHGFLSHLETAAASAALAREVTHLC